MTTGIPSTNSTAIPIHQNRTNTGTGWVSKKANLPKHVRKATILQTAMMEQTILTALPKTAPQKHRTKQQQHQPKRRPFSSTSIQRTSGHPVRKNTDHRVGTRQHHGASKRNDDNRNKKYPSDAKATIAKTESDTTSAQHHPMARHTTSRKAKPRQRVHINPRHESALSKHVKQDVIDEFGQDINGALPSENKAPEDATLFDFIKPKIKKIEVRTEADEPSNNSPVSGQENSTTPEAEDMEDSDPSTTSTTLYQRVGSFLPALPLAIKNPKLSISLMLFNAMRSVGAKPSISKVRSKPNVSKKPSTSFEYPLTKSWSSHVSSEMSAMLKKLPKEAQKFITGQKQEVSLSSFKNFFVDACKKDLFPKDLVTVFEKACNSTDKTGQEWRVKYAELGPIIANTNNIERLININKNLKLSPIDMLSNIGHEVYFHSNNPSAKLDKYSEFNLDINVLPSDQFGAGVTLLYSELDHLRPGFLRFQELILEKKLSNLAQQIDVAGTKEMVPGYSYNCQWKGYFSNLYVITNYLLSTRVSHSQADQLITGPCGLKSMCSPDLFEQADTSSKKILSILKEIKDSKPGHTERNLYYRALESLFEDKISILRISGISHVVPKKSTIATKTKDEL